MEKQGKVIEENTVAIKELTNTIRDFKETDRDVVRTIEYCKTVHQATLK